jgi:hypothetical protein
MKDNVLKKQFVEKDVQRLRNLVQGKYADKSQTSVGFTKKQEDPHSEGDIWVEENKTWTIKNGIKQNVTKLDAAKEAVNFPIFCPSCKKVMKLHVLCIVPLLSLVVVLLFCMKQINLLLLAKLSATS